MLFLNKLSFVDHLCNVFKDVQVGGTHFKNKLIATGNVEYFDDKKKLPFKLYLGNFLLHSGRGGETLLSFDGKQC